MWLARGMLRDLRRRAPYYISDWIDAWDYRVIPSTIYMFFANILPALAFSLDMFTSTSHHYGVSTTLLASVLGAVVFSLFACQPLVIVGVTGPITVFNSTVYSILSSSSSGPSTPYLPFMCMIALWSLLLHTLLAVTNSCNLLRYITKFPCEVFGFYVATIYLQKGIQVLARLGHGPEFYLSVTVSLLVFLTAITIARVGSSRLFTRNIRTFLADYGTPLTVVFFTGFVHIGRMREVHVETLPKDGAFRPSGRTGWFVDPSRLSTGEVFLALPFGILLTILFWFDHNVSSLIAQGTEFPLRKPAGFHWDLLLLGVTTAIAGLLGLPFPNGLIPQAPFHTASLCVQAPPSPSYSSSYRSPTFTTAALPNPEAVASRPLNTSSEKNPPPSATHVVEQRVSNLAQGLLTLIFMTGPLQTVLHTIPHGVLAGLFFVMAMQAQASNPIVHKIAYLLRDPSVPLHDESSIALYALEEPRMRQRGHLRRENRLPLTGERTRNGIRWWDVRDGKVWTYVGLQLLAVAGTMAVTETKGAVGFPVVIMVLIPVRWWVLGRWFDEGALEVLDGRVASEFTMESCGG